MSSCLQALDEVSVTVDTTHLAAAAAKSPELAIGVVVGLVGLGVAVGGAKRWHRLWSLLIVIPAGITWVAFQEMLGKVRWLQHLDCAQPLALDASAITCLAFTIAAACVAQLSITVGLRAVDRQRAWWPAAVLLAVAALTAAVIGFNRRAALTAAHTELVSALPVPNVRPPELPPQAHVGLTVITTPYAESAGDRSGFFFPTRFPIDPTAAKAWDVATLALTPTEPGVQQLHFHRERGPLSLDFDYPVRGAQDEGPAWLPLAVGNRWEFVGTAPLGLDKTLAKLQRKGAVMPKADVALEVTEVFEKDGLRGFTLQVQRKDERTETKVVRIDGQLFALDSTVALAGPEDCRVPFLWARSQCRCAVDRLEWCVEIDQDGFGLFVRLALGALTLGLTEITGATKGMGEAHERRGLVLTRWRVDAVERTISR
ncbi:MAG: hypothetical protein U0228_33815 [Myxococcaceae bacterium]